MARRRMNRSWVFVVALLGCLVGAGSAVFGAPAAGPEPGVLAPKLVNERPLFTGDIPAYKRPNQYAAWSMRLSPGGKHVLYSRPKPGQKVDPTGLESLRKAAYELVLHELATGKETVLPVALVDDEVRSGYTRYNFFAPAGDRLLLMYSNDQKPNPMMFKCYDISTATFVTPQVKGRQLFAKFDRTGAGLIFVSADETTRALRLFTSHPNGEELRELKAKGLPSAVCPTADVACVWTPPEPLPPKATGDRPERGPQRLALYDLAADKEIAELPLNQANSKLDDWECQWTSDGRYLYYYDVRDAKTSFTHAWDRVGGKSVAEVDDAVAVGPGPTPTTMFLARLRWTLNEPSKGFLLHDAGTGKSWALGEGTDLIHAWGRTALYSKKDAAGVEVPYVAEIQMGDGASAVK